MKWLFLLLVLANAGFIAWQGFSGADLQVAKQPIYAPPVSEKIYLIGEARPEEPEATPERVVSSSERIAEEINQAIAQTSSEQPRQQLLCPVVTLERDRDVEIVVEALNDAQLNFTRNETSGVRDKYWLYIPAPETTAKARAIVTQLKQQKIDSYVVGTGAMKGRISLGLFSARERAEQAQASIADRTNMLVSIYEHQRSVGLVELMLAEPIAELDWQRFLSGLDLSKLLIKIEKNPC